MPRPKKQHLKQRKDGRFCAVYQGRQFMGRTESEALAARAEYVKSLKTGVANAVTLGEYAAAWMPVHKASVKSTTYNAYASILTAALAGYEGIALHELTTDDLSAMFASLAGKSASYIHKARILLTEILDSAVDAGYMLRNPVRAGSVKPPRGTRGTHRALTQDERLLILTTPHRMQIPALIMLYCGLRRGEVLALTAEDVGRSIKVNKAAYFVGNRPRLSAPKTDAGVRAVPVPPVLEPFLTDLHGLIAPGRDGGMMTETAFSRGWESYQKALSAAAGHPVSIRCHDLRVTYCTMARDGGVDPKILQNWMGHEDISMIMRIYDQPGNEREKDAENRLFSVLNMQNDMQDKSKTPETVEI